MQGGRRCIYLVRHAESKNNANDCNDGQETPSPRSPAGGTSKRVPDPGLTPIGVRQAHYCAAFFQKLQKDENTPTIQRPTALRCSGMRRAMGTAAPIAAALGVPPVLLVESHEEGGMFHGPRSQRGAEGDYPLCHGMTPAELRELLPQMQGLEGVPPGGWWPGGKESAEHAAERAARLADSLWEASFSRPESDGAVVCVSHGLFMSRLLMRMLGLRVGEGFAETMLLTANCGFWLLELERSPGKGRRAAVLAANVVDHIPPNIRRGHTCRGFSYCLPRYDVSEEDVRRCAAGDAAKCFSPASPYGGAPEAGRPAADSTAGGAPEAKRRREG
eukprot:TRINITY_DN46887_c0_g1_i1.p1 TRINITY_DN46887_c0_g1~~TRINITY_DN46887_c0_g1_i1.p1  ORF type:complete len:358 (+),score=110.35 TRINITY_DN46887_c0_g1_i1:82-1074(+)